MSEQQISTTLQTMTNTLQMLSQSLKNEKERHITLLRDLNTHITHSQQDIKDDIHHFISQIELTQILNVVRQSNENIKKHQNNIDQLDLEIEKISAQVNSSIHILEHNIARLTERLDDNSQLISANLVKQITLHVKDSITTQFINQFEEQNKNLIFEIEQANNIAVEASVATYNELIKEVQKTKVKHNDSLADFEQHVDSFNKKITNALKNVDDAFFKVQENNQQNMDELYDSCRNFQKQIIQKLNAETDQINHIFDQKISDLAQKVDTQISQSLEKMSHVEQQIHEKTVKITEDLEKNTDKNLGITQRIIEKQEVFYRNLCDKLTIKYFALNTISILFVVFIVLVGFNIAASKRYSEISDFNNALVSQNQKLLADNTKLSQLRVYSLNFTKQSINEVKKKFPELQVTLNCKSLD